MPVLLNMLPTVLTYQALIDCPEGLLQPIVRQNAFNNNNFAVVFAISPAEIRRATENMQRDLEECPIARI